VKLIADFILNFKGYYGCNSKCGIEIYQNRNKNIVIMTELPENKGTSVTNACEAIATILFKNHNINPEDTIYIEHYHRDKKDTYDLIMFNKINQSTETNLFPYPLLVHSPKWKRLGTNKEKILNDII